MELKFVIESLLFTAQKPMSVREIREVLSVAAEKGEEEVVKAFKKGEGRRDREHAYRTREGPR